MTIQLKVLYFGSARDQTGVKEEDFRIAEGTTLKGFVEQAFTKYPGLAQVGSLIVAVNCEYEQPTSARVLRDQDEVAFVPPVSGG